jgi:hypothetical protein
MDAILPAKAWIFGKNQIKISPLLWSAVAPVTEAKTFGLPFHRK